MMGTLRVFLCVLLAAPAFAQDYPYRPIRIIAPNPAGGGTMVGTDT